MSGYSWLIYLRKSEVTTTVEVNTVMNLYIWFEPLVWRRKYNLKEEDKKKQIFFFAASKGPAV